MKTRATDNENKIRKKYFREPKIYQNDYIDNIYNKKMFRFYQTIKDSSSKSHVILFIFFVEKKEYFLLLGRRENQGDFEDSSCESKSCNDSQSSSQAQSKGGTRRASKRVSKRGSKTAMNAILNAGLTNKRLDKALSLPGRPQVPPALKEKSQAYVMEMESDDEDDDSPYFVKITLDEMFLSHLQMPDIVSGNEVDGKYEEIIQNEIFQQIIQREISMMFGVEEKQEKSKMSNKRVTIERADGDMNLNNIRSGSAAQASAVDSSDSSVQHKEKLDKIKDGTAFENVNGAMN